MFSRIGMVDTILASVYDNRIRDFFTSILELRRFVLMIYAIHCCYHFQYFGSIPYQAAIYRKLPKQVIHMTPKTPILSVSYELRPPSSTSVSPELSTIKTHAIPIQVPNRDGPQSGESFNAYYAALRGAIAQAKDVTGRELTEWRDAVGDGEKEKTGGKEEEISEEGEVAGEDDLEAVEVKER